MCRDLTLCRKPSVLKTSINIITTTATPTFRALRSWTSEGEDRGEGDKWSPCRLRVASFSPRPRHVRLSSETLRESRWCAPSASVNAASLQRLLFVVSQIGWRLILLGRHQEPICA